MFSAFNVRVLLLGFVLSAVPIAVSQTLAERLGYPPGTKLIIVHADDLGETHAVNAAAIKALQGGTITPTDKVPGLVDENGYLYHDWEHKEHPNAKEVEIELHAQIERALAMGVRPTHLDSHQYRLIINGKELFDAMLRVAHEYKLPVFVTKDWFADHPYLQESLGPDDIVLDHTVTIEPDVPPEKWADFYLTALKNLKLGVTEFVIHPGFDDEELRAATKERSTWGSAWRQRDYDFFTSEQFREILAQQNIKLITWRELTRRAAPK